MVRVLLFMEDPGAANYMRTIPGLLKQLDWKVFVYSVSYATRVVPNELDLTCLETLDGASKAACLINSVNPDIVFVGTSENKSTIAFDLIELCALKSIPSIGFVDSVANSAFRFRGHTNNPLYFKPNFLFVPDNTTLNKFIKLGFSPNKMFVFRNPHFGDLRAKKLDWSKKNTVNLQRKMLGLPLDKTIVVFVSELSTGLNCHQFLRSSEYTLNGLRSSTHRTEIVLDEFLMAINEMETKPFLVLRLHPKQNKEELKRYVECFDKVSEIDDGLELVYCADLVVGMSSVLLHEAFALGSRVISILPRSHEKSWLGDIIDSIPCFTERMPLQKYFKNWENDGITISTEEENIDSIESDFIDIFKGIINSKRL